MLGDYYVAIKSAHVLLAICSGSLFMARGLGVLMDGAWPLSRSVRRLSVAIDSLLLLAALLQLWILWINPFALQWLSVKLTLLVFYIVCGSFALKRCRSKAAKTVAYTLALLCFTLIFAIARTRDPGFLIGF